MSSNISECLRWKLYPDEYSINGNETLTETYRYITISTKDYFVNNKKELFICVPSALQPPFYYMDLVYACEWMISSIFLSISVLIHCLKSKSNVVTNGALLCHEISLIAYYLTAFSYAVAGPNEILAYVAKYFGSYICRCAFCWLVVINYDKWRQLRPENITRISTSPRIFCLQSAFAWCVPALIVGGTSAMGLLGINTNSLYLEFHHNGEEEIFMYTTTEIILVINLVLFILTVRNLHRYGKSINHVNQNIFKQLSVVYLKLMIVTGLIWIFSVIEWALMQRTPGGIWIAVDVISALQGFFIFLVYHANPREK